jgi:hypothetical protein
MLAGAELPVFEKPGRILQSTRCPSRYTGETRPPGLYKNEKFFFLEIFLNTEKTIMKMARNYAK